MDIPTWRQFQHARVYEKHLSGISMGFKLFHHSIYEQCLGQKIVVTSCRRLLPLIADSPAPVR